MADDNKIKLQIDSEANVSGAKKAEKAIDEVGDAAKKQGQQADRAADSTEGLDRALRGANEAAREGNALMREFAEWSEKRAEIEREASEESRKAENAAAEASDLLQIRRAEQERVLNDLAGKLGAVSRIIKQSGQEVAEFDEGLGKVITTVGEVGETSESVLSGMASGFALGGPAGAAVGGFVGLIKDQLLGAYQDMIQALKDQHEAQERAKTSADNLKGTLEDLGEEAARDRLSTLQRRLNDELETIRELNDELEHNIKLERIRKAGENKVNDIQRETERDDIRRKIRDGEISPNEGAGNLVASEFAGKVEKLERELEPFRQGIALLKGNQEVLLAERQRKEEEAESLRTAAEEAERAFDSGVALSDETLQDLISSNVEAVRDLATANIKTRGGLLAFSELANQQADALDAERKSDRDNAIKIGEKILRAQQTLAATQDAKVAQLEAEKDRQLAQVTDDLTQQAKNVFKPAFENIKEQVSALGLDLSKREKEALENLKRISTNAENDALERDEFSNNLGILQARGIDQNNRLIRIVDEGLREIGNMVSKIQSLEGRLNELTQRIKQLAGR